MEALVLNPYDGVEKTPETAHSKEEATKEPVDHMSEDMAFIRSSLDPDNIKKLISQGLAKEISNLNLPDLQTVSFELKEVRYQLESLQEKRASIFTRKSLLLGLAMLVGSLITSGGIYYFFPQKVVLNRVADLESYKMFQQGMLLTMAFKKMPKAEKERVQKLMETCWPEYYQALVKG
jgi:hypothetical protein